MEKKNILDCLRRRKKQHGHATMLRRSFMVILLFSIFLSGSSCDPALLDEGRLTNNGIELTPFSLPWHVVADDSFEQEGVVEQAIDWWNEKGAGVLFEGGVDNSAFDELTLDAPSERIGVILVSVEGIPGGGTDWVIVDEEDPNGKATVYDDGGLIMACDVIIDYEIAYHEGTVYTTLIHEFGHCLGLADDPESLDLDSCMSKPTYEGCGLTGGDLQLLLE